MDSDLISKKELLKLTDISYGQLYRWKRKNLIPEEWFIRKSTYTGQETFFPKERILERISKIKNMKEDISLDDLANMLSPNLMELSINKTKLIDRKIVSKSTIEYYLKIMGETNEFEFEKILFIYILEKMFQSGTINFEEGEMILNLLVEFYTKYKGKNCELLFIRKLGISSACLVLNPNQTYFETQTNIIERIDFSELIEELKIKLA
jgi:hypothetical protein